MSAEREEARARAVGVLGEELVADLDIIHGLHFVDPNELARLDIANAVCEAYLEWVQGRGADLSEVDRVHGQWWGLRDGAPK